MFLVSFAVVVLDFSPKWTTDAPIGRDECVDVRVTGFVRISAPLLCRYRNKR